MAFIFSLSDLGRYRVNDQVFLRVSHGSFRTYRDNVRWGIPEPAQNTVFRNRQFGVQPLYGVITPEIYGKQVIILMRWEKNRGQNPAVFSEK
jgi:hypothetical protein